MFRFFRDDAGKFVVEYPAHGILKADPSRCWTRTEWGLTKTPVERGCAARKNVKLSIRGECGAEPSLVEFCHTIGLDYVSYSPYRVPIAWLSAARRWSRIS